MQDRQPGQTEQLEMRGHRSMTVVVYTGLFRLLAATSSASLDQHMNMSRNVYRMHTRMFQSGDFEFLNRLTIRRRWLRSMDDRRPIMSLELGFLPRAVVDGPEVHGDMQTVQCATDRCW